MTETPKLPPQSSGTVRKQSEKDGKRKRGTNHPNRVRNDYLVNENKVLVAF